MKIRRFCRPSSPVPTAASVLLIRANCSPAVPVRYTPPPEIPRPSRRPVSRPSESMSPSPKT